VLIAGCGGSNERSVDLRGTVPLLRSDLRAHGVGKRATLDRAWLAFTDFSGVRVADPPIDEELSLFEFGVFDGSLVVSLVRQLELEAGSIQQVHLELRYPLRLAQTLIGRLGVEECSRGGDCIWRCSFAEDNLSMLVGTRCRLDADTPKPHVLLSANTWSDRDVAAWRAHVAASTPFRFLRTRRALAYQVWRDHAD
jgi:hypothetical protein